ncbi:MAG: response regulator [Bdellovibrionota bacterium]
MATQTSSIAGKQFSKYIGNKKILIADPGATTRASIASMMLSMGAQMKHLILVNNFEKAVEEIESQRPHVVLCDFDLGKNCGLDLLQSQRQQHPETKDVLFILVTGNTSQSAVAQAAEEDVDTYVLKPFTPEILRNAIMKCALQKINPNNYYKKIEEGKKHLFAPNLEMAMKCFEEATNLDPKPSLANFYYGQAYLMKQALTDAEGRYTKGLEFNRIHYKCLVGLFDLMMLKKMHEQAYDVVKRIARYFPANPQRLTQVVRLAIMTRAYEDIERYFQIFRNLDTRNDDLVRSMSAALVVCGKYYLQQELHSRALELFDKAAKTGFTKLNILKEIVTSLLAVDMLNESREFLKRFPLESRDTSEYLATEFMLTNRTHPATFIVSQGRKLVDSGIADPSIYKIMIERSKQLGVIQSAESFAFEGSEKWPELKSEFHRILKDTAVGVPVPPSPTSKEDSDSG